MKLIKLNLLILAIFISILSIISWDKWPTSENDKWLSEDNEIQINNDQFNDEFSSGESLVVAIKLSKEYFNNDIIKQLIIVENNLKEHSHINRIKTPLNVSFILKQKGTLNNITFRKALEENHLKDIFEYKKEFIKSGYYGRYLSKDFKTLIININVNIPPKGKNIVRSLVHKKVKEILDNNLYFKDYHIIGEIAIYNILDTKTRNNLDILLPLCILLVFLGLGLFLKSISKMIIIAISSLGTIWITIKIIALTNHPLTIVSISLPMIVFIIGIADSIHIIHRRDKLKEQGLEGAKLIEKLFKICWLPCFLTSFTTAIGFISFISSEIIPLKNYAIDAFISIIIAFGYILTSNCTLLYALDKFIKRTNTNFINIFNSIHNNIYNLVINYKKSIVTLFLIIGCLTTVAIKNANIESNFIEAFFKKNSKIYKDTQYFDNNLKGSTNINLTINKDKDDFKKINNFNKLKRLKKKLLKHKYIYDAHTYIMPISMVQEAFTLEKGNKFPINDNQLSQNILFLEFSRNDKETDVLSSYVSFKYNKANILMKTPNLPSSTIDKLKEFILKESRLLFKDINLTGTNVFISALSKYILDTQIISIMATLFAIYLLFILCFGFYLSNLAILANCFPIVFILGLMSLLQVPFDFATVIISSVTLGICVDDTVHFIHDYKIRGKITKELLHTINYLGIPLFITTFIFCIGFAIFIKSDMVILIRFGIFSTISLLMAYISNMIFLPSLLSIKNQKS